MARVPARCDVCGNLILISPCARRALCRPHKINRPHKIKEPTVARTPKIKITARKYGGDDAYSWAIFASDQARPVVTGLTRSEVPYYRAQVDKIKNPPPTD